MDLGSNPLVVVPGSTAQPVEVTLRDDGGTISGIVGSQEAGAPNPNAAGEPPQCGSMPFRFLHRSRAAQRDAQFRRRFLFYAVAPGSYRVVACDAQQEIDFHSPKAWPPGPAKAKLSPSIQAERRACNWTWYTSQPRRRDEARPIRGRSAAGFPLRAAGAGHHRLAPTVPERTFIFSITGSSSARPPAHRWTAPT